MNIFERVEEIERFLRFAQDMFDSGQAEHTALISRRCSRCILSDRCLPIGEDGCCAECRKLVHGERTVGGPAGRPTRDPGRLDDLLERTTASAKGSYGAVLMLSGGKDTAYLAHALTTRHSGLRLLGVFVDNGFASEVAIENARAVAAALEIDFQLIRPRLSLFRTGFRRAFLVRDRSCCETVDFFDGELTHDIGRSLAARLGIPLVISGLSPAQVESILGLTDFKTPGEWNRRKRTHVGDVPLTGLYDDPDYALWWDGSARPLGTVPEMIFPFYVWDYDERNIYRTVADLALLSSRHTNPLITNNQLIPLMIAVDYARRGYFGYEPEFARLVREERADRDAWLRFFCAAEYLASRNEFLPRCIDSGLERLNLTRGDLDLRCAGAPSQ